MLEELQLKPNTTDELKVALQTIWEELPQEHINKAVANRLHQAVDCLRGCQW